MPKRKTKTSVKKELLKLQLPGILISDLIELAELLPDLILNLTKSSYCLALIAQLRANTSLNVSPSDYFKMESINTYIRTFLSKSDFLTYVAAAVAIRKTMAAYTNDSDPNSIVNDHRDLCENKSGASNMHGGAVAAMQSPERLRSFRRGVMLQLVGKFQFVPVYTPLKVSRDIERIGPHEFISCLPFEVDSSLVDLSQMISELKSALSSRSFTDLYLPEKDSLLEAPLDVTRVEVKLPRAPELKELQFEQLPVWRKAAIAQSKQLRNKKG